MLKIIKLSRKIVFRTHPIFASLPKTQIFYFAKSSGAKVQKKQELQKEKSEANIPQEIDFAPYEEKNKKVFQAFESEVRNIKIGKLTPDTFKSIFLGGTGVSLSVYDTSQILPVNATTVSITPFEQSQKKAVYQALERDKFNEFQINLEDKDKYLVSIPAGSTNEKKKKLLKMVQDIGEKYKVQLRELRHEFIKSQEKFQKFLPKDVVKSTQDEITLVFEKAVENLEKLVKAKEKEFK